MSTAKSCYYATTGLVSDITALYCVFLFLSAAGTGDIMIFSIPAYLTCAILSVLINVLLARKERSVITIAAVNAITAAASGAVILLFPHRIGDAWGYLLAWAAFLYPAPRGFYLLRNPLDAEKMLRRCELSILGTSFFFFLQLGAIRPGITANALCLTALIGNLAALSSMRILGALRTDARGGVNIRRWLSVVAIAAGLLLFAILLSLMLPFGRGAALAVLGAAGRLIMTVLSLIQRFFLYLVSLLPTPEPGHDMAFSPDLFKMPEIREHETREISFIVVAVITSALAIGAIVMLVRALYRVRGVRVGRMGRGSVAQRAKGDAPSLFSLLRGVLKKLWDKAELYLLLLTRLHTCEGMMVRLEHRGRRCGIPRLKGQTPREFLMLLGGRALPEDEQTREAFLYLADRIDELCFSPGRGQSKLDSARVDALLKATRPTKRRGAPPVTDAGGGVVSSTQ